MKKYEKYKRTESDWLPHTPSHWGFKRTKWIFKEIDERSESGQEELMSVSNYTGVTRRSEKNITMFMAEDYSGYKLCSKNDLVVNILWAWMGAMGIAPERGIVSTAYGVYRFRNPTEMHPAYFEYLVRIPQLVIEYGRRSKGVTPSRARLYSDSLFQIEFPIPPLIEQRAITGFLDYKCRQIDTFIEKKKRLIALLEEQRFAVMNQAITKGLDPNPQLRNTTNGFIGMIPVSWEVRKLKYMVKILNGQDAKEVEDEDGLYPIIGSGGEFGRANSYLSMGPSVLLGRKGTIDKPQFVDSPFWAVDTAFFTKISSLVLPKYFYFLCRLIDFGRYQYGSAIPSMTQFVLNNIHFAIPRLEEQIEILNYLKNELRSIDLTISAVEKEIDLVVKYKKSLIAHAVLGKIDVRDWTPPRKFSPNQPL